jgi:hypothetical protein
VLEYAHADAMGEADLLALHRLFWKIWAHPKLIAFPLVVASLREIGRLAKRMWMSNSIPSEWSAGHFSRASWRNTCLSIVSEIGIDERIEHVAAGKNAMLWQGVGLNAVYAMLCDTHFLQGYRESTGCCRDIFCLPFHWLSEN